MRLLDTVTAKFVEKDPTDWTTRYSILSHAWDTTKGEQTYQEVKEIQRRYTTVTRHCPPPQREPYDSGTTHSRSLFSKLLGRDGPPHPSSPPQSSGVSYSDPLPHVSLAEAPLSPIWDDHELSPKIRDACAFARANGYRYLWIDSCCIDKTSSTELSEAINSMYQWYTHAEVCYAYLADVTSDEDPRVTKSKFRCSRWFTRGWTLQELIAPAHVEFLAKDWTSIGSKRSLGTLVSTITGIHYTALLRLEPLSEFSIAQRFSWASRRQTTRVEDRAYSLLGFFDINMPLLYGEGEHAFWRLQEEIMRRIPDQSLFAWSWNKSSLYFHSLRGEIERRTDPFRSNPHLYDRKDTASACESLLAPSPDLFRSCGKIEAVPYHEVTQRLHWGSLDVPTPSYDFTPHGIRTQLPVIPLSLYLRASRPLPEWYLVVLGCEHSALPGHLLGRVCNIPTSRSGVPFLHCGQVPLPFNLPSPFVADSPHLLAVHPQCIAEPIDLKTVHIPYRNRVDAPRVVAFCKTHERFRLALPKKTRRALSAQGYTPTLKLDGADTDTSHRPTGQWLTLLHSDKSHSVIIEFQHTLDSDGVQLSLEAYVRLAGPGRPHKRPDCWELVGTMKWTDSYPWAQVLEERVVVAIAGCKTLRVALELHLASPDHYVPQVEICAESSSIGSHSESISFPSSKRPRKSKKSKKKKQEPEGAEDVVQARVEPLEIGVQGGGTNPTDGVGDLRTGTAPSWWTLPCDF